VARILLVDDDALFREVVHKILVRAGHVVADAANGDIALTTFGRESFDLVITDIVMPDKEGLDTIRTLRRQAPDLRIIAMSGGGVGGTGDYLSVARRLGAARVLAKPFSAVELVDTVAGVLAEPPADAVG
jgi:DNA-binding response OmpR family regulator